MCYSLLNPEPVFCLNPRKSGLLRPWFPPSWARAPACPSRRWGCPACGPCCLAPRCSAPAWQKYNDYNDNNKKKKKKNNNNNNNNNNTNKNNSHSNSNNTNHTNNNSNCDVQRQPGTQSRVNIEQVFTRTVPEQESSNERTTSACHRGFAGPAVCRGFPCQNRSGPTLGSFPIGLISNWARF